MASTGRGKSSGGDSDYPREFANVPAPTGGMPDGSLTLQALMDIKGSLREVSTKTERLITDVEGHRAELRTLSTALARLEVEVKHLPSKGFIVFVVTTFLVIVGGLISIAPKLQALVGTETVSSAVR